MDHNESVAMFLDLEIGSSASAEIADTGGNVPGPCLVRATHLF